MESSRRSCGRSRKRWIEDVEKDFRNRGMRRWRRLGNETAEWKKFVGEAKINWVVRSVDEATVFDNKLLFIYTVPL